MAAITYNARQTARDVSKVLGHAIDAKRVRGWVREHIAAYDDDGYTAHVYNAETHKRIVAGMTAKAATGRAKAATIGRASKPAVTAARKAESRTAAKVGPSFATPPTVPVPAVTKA